MEVIIHLVARALEPPVLLHDHDLACWLWERMRAAFPEALAVVLMPNHAHLVTPTDDPTSSQHALARIVGNLCRSKGPARSTIWQPVPAPDVITDPVKRLRLLRYVALNPVRAGLVTDALEWPWSTQRDVLGAIACPWVDAKRVAAAVSRDARGFGAWWHRYVSVDTAAGPYVPLAAPERPRLARMPLDWIACAAASATRSRVEDIRRPSETRRLFLGLAVASGWDWSSRLAEACAMTPRGVLYNLRQPDPVALQAGLRCLADPRLRIPSQAVSPPTWTPLPKSGNPNHHPLVTGWSISAFRK
ncbi:MAG: hypothetical protein JNK04_20275 [Myxococcales bacterium]|nr:hypothetical protein [Myxococcales bacterium]